MSEIGRRRALTRLGAIAVAVATPIGAQPRPLVATPPDAEGPFYPTRFPVDTDADLTRISGRASAARGTPLALSGRVVALDGTPLAGTRIELWQCDVNGRYHHVDGDPGERDDNFQGYGVVTTDSDGRYAFTTIRPVPYGGRPPHLHFKLSHARAKPLTTQLYPRGESAERTRGFGLSAPDARSRLEFATTPRSDGALTASYDFVLRG
ncbi:MAG TPA: intradiol ring-cleavage dioxygenase [Casimicrobiaceae bacterium]|nr:intradiol ring-cleavage dioxygenase [Casimicrobiaceae bacterium]